jgi:hypothetical protein
MPNEFIARNGITSLGNVIVTGSLTATGTINMSGSIASASFAATASSADNLLVRSTLTAQTLVVQTITSSIDFVTGSTRFGSISENTHQFTGSVNITGSTNLAGSLKANKIGINVGDLNLDNFSTLGLIVSGAIGFGNSGGAAALVGRDGSGNTTFYGGSGDINFTDLTFTSNYLTIKNAGNVGIGITNPSTRLHISSSTGGLLEVDGANAINALFVSSSGNVGIGTTTPGAPLEISYNNTSFTTTPILSLNNTNINGQTHINFLITGSLVGKIRSDYEGGMLYVTNNRGADRAHYFLVNGDVGTGSVVMAIKANGKVGIGTQLPSSTLGIASTGADGLIMEADLSNTQNSSRLFFTGSVQTFGLFNNAGDLRLTHGAQAGNTSGTSFVRFTNTGKYLRMEGSTGGIQFGGDTAAANALNDYEEGTWTPTIAGGGGDPTYVSGNRVGWYTKVGRVVTITWFISFFKNTLSGTLRLTNFPFSLLNGPLFYPQGTVLLDTLGTTTNNITMQGANNSASGDFIGGNGTTSTHTGLPISVLGAGEMQCRGTLTYFTA